MTSISKREAERELVVSSFPIFVAAMKGKDFFTPFHLRYYKVLNAFAQGRIKRLIITIPPQHGKSEGSTRLLPAYLLGLNPDLKIAIASYADTLAKSFNRSIQRIIVEKKYSLMFPDTKLQGGDSDDGIYYTRNSNEFEVVGKVGGLKAVGRGGGITGLPVDVFIMDDLYKDAMEGNSPTIRDSTWEWYTSVVKTRLHNDSQELIVFTRWHEDDLIGRIESKETVINLTSMADIVIDRNSTDVWYKLNFEAIKETSATKLDPRGLDEPLWLERHNLVSLKAKRNLGRLQFDCMYQGSPMSKEGQLYGDNFQTYTIKPNIIKKGNYTDTADTGEDYLCSICYEVGEDKKIYVTDILYTQEPMEVTEPATSTMLIRNDTRIAHIESNNGGRGFARAVASITPLTKIEWFHQSTNKESRILTNSATVMTYVIMPSDWKLRWPQFYLHITGYKRIFRTNKSDDPADVLTGIVEREVVVTKKPINKKRIAAKVH